MHRRAFIKTTCLGCAGLSLIGLTVSQISSCAPAFPIFKTSFKGNRITVPLSSFVESNLLIVRDMQVEFDILLVRKSVSDYTAIYMKCSHQSNPVTATRNGLYCSSHGSSFDLDGQVTKEPANGPLQLFPTELKDETIIIHANL